MNSRAIPSWFGACSRFASITILHYVVGKPNAAFIEAAADVDGDGVVDIADAVRIVNLVVGKIPALAREFDFSMPDPQ